MARLMLSCGVRPGIASVLLAFSGLVASSAFADEVVRVMAANITSGNGQSYDEGHGNRIFQGLDPDIALVQEMNVGNNTTAEYRAWVNTNFGTAFSYHVEVGKSIPNGIVSRYPIVSSGVWDDDQMTDREFVWARIDIPGDTHLWAVSVHLKASSGSDNVTKRNTQATNLRTYIQNNVPASDYVVIGGDMNTQSRSESCLTTFSSIVVTSAPYPVDQNGDGDTNAGRDKPYDWVMPGSSLAARSTPLVIGNNSFANGLVFDSRDYTPLSAVSPVQSGDSDATGMQHMAVMRAFLIPTNVAPVIAQGTSASVTLSKNNTPVAFSLSLSATDADADPLSWDISTAAVHGTAGIVAPASGGAVNLSYQPATNYTGADSFLVRVSDGQGGTDTITVNLTIQPPPNTAPVIQEGTSVAATLSQNNYPNAFGLSLTALDAESNPLQWSISSPASHGTAVVVAPASGSGVSLSYQPVNGYTGNDSFVVQVSDGQGGADTVIVNLTIQAAPSYDKWTYDRFAPLTPASEASVWGDEADPDGDGYRNLEEFTHGLDPNAADSAPNLMSCVREAIGEGSSIVLSFKIRMDGEVPALVYTPEVASGLDGAWTELPASSFVVVSETDLGGGFTQRKIRLNGGVEGAARFFRLTMSR